MSLVIQYTHVHGFRPALFLRFQTNTRAPVIDSAGRKSSLGQNANTKSTNFTRGDSEVLGDQDGQLLNLYFEGTQREL